MQIAAAIADFKGDLEIVEEPVAAFLYHRHMQWNLFHSIEPSLALIVDFGGGTCDIALIQYQDGKLPIVIGRAMAKLGGNRIDEEILKTFWISQKRKGNLISAEDYANLDEDDRTVLLTYARRVKESLSGGEDSRQVEIKGIGVLPPYTYSPIITKKEFHNFLKFSKIEKVHYADDPDLHSETLAGHLYNLVNTAITSAKLPNGQNRLKKLIFAGGSSALPFIKEWVLKAIAKNGMLTFEEKDDTGDSNIIDNDLDVCVAEGAAVHQLYIHHQKKEWKGAVTTTLPWNISLFHNLNREGKEVEIALGKQGDRLPIDGTGYWGKSTLISPVRLPETGKPYYVIRQGRNADALPTVSTNKTPLDDNLGARNPIIAGVRGILVNFFIDKYGILRIIKLNPKSMLTFRNKHKGVDDLPFLGENDLFIVTLRKLQTLFENKRDISNFNSKFIPKTTR